MINKLVVGICVFLQVGCNNRTAQPSVNSISENKVDVEKSHVKRTDSFENTTNPYPEHWTWENETSYFELDLVRHGDSIKGKYCAIAYNGEKIDCSHDTFDTLSNYLTGTKFEGAYLVSFKSGFDDENEKDTAFITYDNKRKTVLWIRKTSNLTAFVPDIATLR